MKKVLIVASVASMIDQFNMPNIELLQQLGYEVHVACNYITGNTCSNEKISDLKNTLKKRNIKIYQVDFSRDIKQVGKIIKAYSQIKKIIKENQYELIHCHSPIGGLLTRVAANEIRKKGTKVIYTAHGFHFFKGSPLINWILYYPIEKACAKLTDILITINKEDYLLAQNKFSTKQIEYIPGIGIDVAKFQKKEINKDKKRKEFNITNDAYVMLSVGELNKNKNHEVVINAMKELKDEKVHYIIAGKGLLKDDLQQLAIDNGLDANVHILGFRSDVIELYKMADLYIHPSFREGLPVALMEALACGTKSIASNTRGCIDLLSKDNLFDPYDCKDVMRIIKNTMYDNDSNVQNDMELDIDSINIESIMNKYNILYL